uniref:Transposase IS701-like DDE domain-containing protein n=1 Tax=Nostoc flagelliforme str. Sunitezuoqi TaxID=676037 RepID=E7DPX6_9NOSO|nr:hypothetical protein Nfla_5403 [Nostoc flagelliforme str. Sunitezuoqi]
MDKFLKNCLSSASDDNYLPKNDASTQFLYLNNRIFSDFFQNENCCNKPINIGHCYSILSILPEKETGNAAPWSIPISGERVSLDKSGVEVGGGQISSLMCDSSLTWDEKLCILVADSAYSQRSFLFEQSKVQNIMLKIVIVEPETFRLLGIKGAISQSPDIEVTGDATSGKLGFQLIEQTNPDVVLSRTSRKNQTMLRKVK